MTYASVTVNVDVDVDLSEISTDDLIEELKDRNVQPGSSTEDFRVGSSTEDYRELLEKIHQALVFNDTEKAIAISRTLIYNALGAIC